MLQFVSHALRNLPPLVRLFLEEIQDLQICVLQFVLQENLHPQQQTLVKTASVTAWAALQRAHPPAISALPASIFRQTNRHAMLALQVALPAMMVPHVLPALPTKQLEQTSSILRCALRLLALKSNFLTRHHRHAKPALLTVSDAFKLAFAFNAIPITNLAKIRLLASAPALRLSSSTR